MKINWPWKKKHAIPAPDVSLYISYHSDTGALFVQCYPTDMTDDQVVEIMDLVCDSIECGGSVDLDSYEAMESFIKGEQCPDKFEPRSYGHLTLVVNNAD